MLRAPATNASADEKADWLEMRAFFDEFHRARLDEIIGALHIQIEENEDDIGERDLEIENARQEIEAELAERERGLGEAYPFVLSRNGEVLEFKDRRHRRGGKFYLFCLILSHVTGSRILEILPHDTAIRIARNRYFQCLATLAMAGHLRGPAIWMGWPRETDETILDVVGRACALAQTGARREHAAPTASTYNKDSGIDVLGWVTEQDRPPPTNFAFGQTASGQNWKDKSARNDSESLLRNYFLHDPNCQLSHYTIIPHRLSETEIQQNHYRHGAIFDRTRAPLKAWQGLVLWRSGVHVDSPEISRLIWRWLRSYRLRPGEEYYEA